MREEERHCKCGFKTRKKTIEEENRKIEVKGHKVQRLIRTETEKLKKENTENKANTENMEK